MTSALSELPRAYALRGEGCPRLLAFHEPHPVYRASADLSTRPSKAPARRQPASISRSPQVRLHLKPGQKGTKHLVAEYGDRLICVRYRYDPERKKRLKTVELLVAERDWVPRPPRFRPDAVVDLHVPYADLTTRNRVKQAGATWHPDRRLWQLRYDHVVALGLTHRVVARPASNAR